MDAVGCCCYCSLVSTVSSSSKTTFGSDWACCFTVSSSLNERGLTVFDDNEWWLKNPVLPLCNKTVVAVSQTLAPAATYTLFLKSRLEEKVCYRCNSWVYTDARPETAHSTSSWELVRNIVTLLFSSSLVVLDVFLAVCCCCCCPDCKLHFSTIWSSSATFLPSLVERSYLLI